MKRQDLLDAIKSKLAQYDAGLTSAEECLDSTTSMLSHALPDALPEGPQVDDRMLYDEKGNIVGHIKLWEARYSLFLDLKERRVVLSGEARPLP